ncbi:FAD/NAD(P)-binding oxidoreductase [Gordonia sp. NB41Y]|uniref:NAD(P)/FAD-dependent oxidoreductase n=1 Tax=Gordonia sp. NB41Y TaxID=875808 RepID=UPI0006B192A7|nr:FAD/NAD(P)-binding oxidoreductase [Gordonia sp. NB41Y]KOY49076.1 pyridine nucleotide-disulfide oxidoreductase [Gordonia sp. NB41Y]WLP89648.1 FAD/NAD(P)-binding oxidoreductase [Gordonia sp. NB41Y]
MSDSGAGVVVVGAGLGAIRVAENLRTGGYTAPITLIGDEPYAPYDRPPLSKSVLLGKDDRPDLKADEFYADSQITLRLGTRVTAVDPAAKTVTVDDGSETATLGYDALVLATGLTPRPFPGAENVGGVHVLRTFDDAVTLREEIDGARTAVVIGAGFIGCEVASSLTERGLTVALVEPAPTPLAAALGEQIGALVTRMHIARGVDVRTGVGVAEIVVGDEGAVRAVRLTDGSELSADIVVVGIGSIPVVGYLDGSGIDLAPREAGGGVACDSVGLTGAADVYAVGDVANWRDAEGVAHRAEHWNHTVDQAAIVAREIVGDPEATAITASVPYFWSDQFGLKIQVLGSPTADDTVHVVDDDGTKFLAYYSRDGLLTGVVGAGKVGAVMKTRPKLQNPTPITDVVPAG